MIEVYSWATPNGHKVHIMLEECALPYRAIPVDIGRGDQFEADFLRISPNNKIPALVDPDGPDGRPITLFESGAILVYLAAKTGRFMPEDLRGRYEVLQWLMFQMGGSSDLKDASPSLRSWKNQGIDWNDYPHLKGWFDEIAKRPAVMRGVEVLADLRRPVNDDKARDVLFGSTQYKAR